MRLRRGRSARTQFVDSHLAKTLAFQLRATRDKLGWNQEKLASESGMTQHAISRLESPGYGKPTLTTLKRLAAAMDVGLVVRFVPFSELIDWVSGTPRTIEGLTAAALAVTSFDREQSECTEGQTELSKSFGGGAADLALQSGERYSRNGSGVVLSAFAGYLPSPTGISVRSNSQSAADAAQEAA
jgi:transcriptional regulator with XRE-family HTH domain